jgi:hypothetical protein
MKQSIINENFKQLNYEFEFDFDFPLSGFDYVLLVVYSVFVAPFFLIFNLISSSPTNSNNKKKFYEKEKERMESFSSELCLGPYCLWPKTSDS